MARRVADGLRRYSRPFSRWAGRNRNAETGAFASALRLLHGLALVSLLAALPNLIEKGVEESVFGPLGFAILLVSWSVHRPRRTMVTAVDAVEAVAILMVSLGMERTWQAIVIVLATLWYRSLGGSAWSVVARIALYTSGVAVESAITEGGVSWEDAAVAFGSLPFWVGTAVVARRMGLMLLEHDKVSAIGAVEAKLSAIVVADPDSAPLAELASDSWHELCDVVPGLRIVRLELRDGSLHAVEYAGRWERTPTVELKLDEREVSRWDLLPSIRAGNLPHLDEAAGELCRWGLGPQLDPEGLRRVLVGIPQHVSPRLVTAATGALERTELMQQHARDHVLLGVQAHTDELTGLDNRLGFFATLAILEGKGQPMCLVFVDLDDFKDVNDKYGHAVGDEVLREVAQRLRDIGPTAASVARLGGDEFGVLFEGAGLAVGSQAGERAESALAQPLVTSAGPVRMGMSWGVATVEDGNTSNLLARADSEMYRQKRSHRAMAGRDRRSTA